ncbi:MAG: Bax inhibitor-1/YccA family protein [Acholeplasmatales bacterium]|nr:Bax inhibitor-1/YccA family protein [Acholeplasmatales bacterium]
MKINNPYLKQASENSYGGDATYSNVFVNENVATKKGITLKTLFTLLAAIVAGLIVAVYFNRTIYSTTLTEEQIATNLSRMIGYVVVVGIVDVIAALIGRFFPKTARICAPIYAVGEGSTIGLLCAIGEMFVPGITIAAGLGTAVIFSVVFGMYSLGAFKKIDKIIAIAIAYMISILIISLALFIFSMVSPVGLPWGVVLAIEFLYLGYGCVMLILDFYEADMITRGGVDKQYEWTVVLGLLITVFYIFVELFRIIMILASNKD